MCALGRPFLVGLEVAGAEHIILGLYPFGLGFNVQHGSVEVPQGLGFVHLIYKEGGK